MIHPLTRAVLTIAGALALIGAPAAAAPPTAKVATRVTLQTSEGAIVVQLATRQAPITSANFLRYVDGKLFDGTTFYRASRAPGAPKFGFIQGGINSNPMRSLPPIAHEPTSRTGLRHLDGTISMARNDPGTAMGDFFILVGPAPTMDAHPGGKGDTAGYAAFGHVVGGMDVVRRILAAHTLAKPGSAAMKGQMIAQPVRILTARRAQ